VRLLGGTDGYSLKNVLAAEAAEISTSAFVAVRAGRFAGLSAPLAISFDDFIQTSSDPRHAPPSPDCGARSLSAVTCTARDTKGSCVGCEQFYAPAELTDGRCPEHGKLTDTVGEETTGASGCPPTKSTSSPRPKRT
jgi:methionyl-tRNA synthetase